ncbi:uncharacterized protein CDV56_108552 [Aspergillus thermomutatus]|uniref:Uncharacterized protein n=1 Tax=Aspergillus thermomutatus TaxID=41047 RepID=A0A397HWF8_ASPTH|nr:uncharacterized protein CDV56_108552 [Aspergillus thermomutatus]RHZ64940.1 hypothetical protein CDV56_108552 [Aspergillus thermomutatus]
MNDEPPNYDEATAPDSAAAQMESQAPFKGCGTRFAMLSLAWTDRIRLMRFPESITVLISEVLNQLWPKGIQDVQAYDDSLEIKLRGNPFAHGLDDEKIAIRIAIMGILNEFAKEGWLVPPTGGRVGRIGNYAPFGQKGKYFLDLKAVSPYRRMC